MNEINPNYFFYFLIICYFILFKIKTLSINLSFPLSTLPCLKWYQKEILCFVLIKNKKEFLPHFYFIHSIYVHWKISSVWKKCYCCWSNNNVCYYSFIYFRVTPRVSLRIGKQFSFVFQSSSLFLVLPLVGREEHFFCVTNVFACPFLTALWGAGIKLPCGTENAPVGRGLDPPQLKSLRNSET